MVQLPLGREHVCGTALAGHAGPRLRPLTVVRERLPGPKDTTSAALKVFQKSGAFGKVRTQVWLCFCGSASSGALCAPTAQPPPNQFLAFGRAWHAPLSEKLRMMFTASLRSLRRRWLLLGGVALWSSGELQMPQRASRFRSWGRSWGSTSPSGTR